MQQLTRKLKKALSGPAIGKYRWHLYVAAISIASVLMIITAGSIAPGSFPVGITVIVRQGMSVSEAADLLAQRGIIKSALLYKIYVSMVHNGRGVIAGEYFFEKPESALRVAYRTSYGLEDIVKVKVTIPEGLASSDMARLITGLMCPDDLTTPCSFKKSEFLALAKPQEGYLFPDTYFFYPNATAADIVKEMRANFDARTKGLAISVAMSGRSFSDVIKMASIVEEEASSSIDRRVIAGILWKRIDADMALQVDAPFFYTLGKTSSELTTADLADDSPYNLYRNKGLPPTPIDNPGLGAIEDTLHPTKSDYWFYLSDRSGVTHYSVTFDGHDANKIKYVN